MTYKEKIEEEHRVIFEKCERLYNFIENNPAYKDLCIEEQADLKEQLRYMLGYETVLLRRFNRIKG